MAQRRPAPARAFATLDRRRPRTLSLHLPAPLAVGTATVRVAPLRVGSGLSTWTVSVADGAGGVCAHAVVLTGRPRVPDLIAHARSWPTAQPPSIPAWTDVPVLTSGVPGMPTFLQHLELRPVQGLPLQGEQARCLGHVRLADQGAWDVQHLVAVIDAWWPTVLTVLPSIRPLATVTYAAHVLVDPSTIPGTEPLVYEASMAGTESGFTTETRRLWTPDGRLAVENHQSIVVIA
ncbi:MAG: thioesterase family protein [Jiangellales bacterium]